MDLALPITLTDHLFLQTQTLPVMQLKTLHFFLFSLLLFAPGCLLAQPANDNCENADTILLDVQVFFSTLGATTDGPFHPNSPCPSSQSDSIFSDIWFVHTATVTGELRWSLCGSADFDTRIAVYQAGATCPLTDDDLLDCNEDGPPACTNFESELDFNVVAGETYMLRLGGFGSEEPGAQGSGSFTLTLAPAGPPNDDCENATVITLGEDQPVTNVDATTDGPVHPNDQVCFGFGDDTAQNDVWYSFTSPVTGTIEWSTCDQVNWDSRIIVYGPGASCPVTPDDMIACSDATAGCSNFTNILQFEAVQGETYLLRVGGYGGAQGMGVFDLIEIEPPVPPANDLCTSADSVFIMTAQQADDFDFVFSGTIINSTISTNLIDPSCGNGQGGKFPDVWFRFNNMGLDSVEIRYFSEVQGAGFFLEIFENCNGDTIIGNSCFAYTPDDVDLLVDTITGLSDVPTDYLVRVSGWLFWPPGPFIFQLVGDVVSDTEQAPFPGQAGLSPNPVSRQVHLSLNLTTNADARVKVVNIFGETMLEKNLGSIPAGAWSHTLHTSHVPPGLYTMIVEVEGARKLIRFTKI